MRTIELGLLWAIVLAGCSTESTTEAGAHTNWLKCGDLTDCAKNPAAVLCTDGYCVDGNGKQLTEEAGGSDGGGHRDGGAQSATGGASGASGGRSDGGGSGAAGSGAAATGGAATGGVGGADGGGIQPPACSGSNTEHCANESCVEGGACLECAPGQVCLEIQMSCGALGVSSAQCIPDPCADGALDCSCARVVCDSIHASGPRLTCFTAGKDSFLLCSGGGICASPDTPIDTPDGERPIASLRVGDLVYSVDHDAVVAVPLIRVSRTPVLAHRVIRIVLAGGRVLEISAGHPTADGRRFGELRPGSLLDEQHTVSSAELVPYEHDATYDILPASSTGTYFAAGALIGSTLFVQPVAESGVARSLSRGP